MVDVTPTASKISRGCHQWKWETLTASNEKGVPIGDGEGIVAFADKTVQIVGTFGSATVALQGSNDNTNWHTLHSPDGTALSFTSADLQAVLENPRYIRAFTSGGDGTQDVDVILVGRAIIQLF